LICGKLAIKQKQELLLEFPGCSDIAWNIQGTDFVDFLQKCKLWHTVVQRKINFMQNEFYHDNQHQKVSRIR